MRVPQGDGHPANHSSASRAGTLAVPDPDQAFRLDNGPSTPRPSTSGTDRTARHVLRAAGLAALFGALAALTVPLSRTVELDGQLVPERILTVRAAEPGLLDEVAVSAGDTLAPDQFVARLRSPALDEALRISPRLDAALLARRARLDLHAPPFAARRPDGTADPATLFHGGVVLTEDLPERHGVHLDAGDALLELAVVSAEGGIPFVVHARADEREAQRTRPGMPTRLLVTAIPTDRPRRLTGSVRRVARPPGPDGEISTWQVEILVDPAAVTALLDTGPSDVPTMLRTGFSAEVSIQERRETLVATARRWLRTRRRASYSASPDASRASYRNALSVARTVTDASGPPRS